jgi:hypothetical protein
VRDYLAGIVPGAKGPGHAGIENRRVTLVIDHAGVATDHVAMPWPLADWPPGERPPDGGAPARATRARSA